MKKCVGILSRHAVPNYGSILQAYAFRMRSLQWVSMLSMLTIASPGLSFSGCHEDLWRARSNSCDSKSDWRP